LRAITVVKAFAVSTMVSCSLNVGLLVYRSLTSPVFGVACVDTMHFGEGYFELGWFVVFVPLSFYVCFDYIKQLANSELRYAEVKKTSNIGVEGSSLRP
jgi:hypothetical protein